MVNRILVFIAIIFQAIGVVWGIVLGFQTDSLNDAFSQTQWPVYLGFALLLVAAFQSKSKRKFLEEEAMRLRAEHGLDEEDDSQ